MESPSMMTYVIGAVLVVAVIVGALYFRSKGSTAMIEPTAPAVPVATPTPGPITGLICDKQYYNQKVGFSQYYLTVEGGDLSTAKTVSCDFTARIKDKVLAKASAESPLSDMPQRSGSVFRCTTKAVDVAPGVATSIDVALKDDLGKTSTCTATFIFPR